MSSRYESHLITLHFEKENLKLARSLHLKKPPMIGDKIPILPGLQREIVALHQEEIGEFLFTEIELETEKEGRIPSSLLMLTNTFYPKDEAWGVVPEKVEAQKKEKTSQERTPESLTPR